MNALVTEIHNQDLKAVHWCDKRLSDIDIALLDHFMAKQIPYFTDKQVKSGLSDFAESCAGHKKAGTKWALANYYMAMYLIFEQREHKSGKGDWKHFLELFHPRKDYDVRELGKFIDKLADKLSKQKRPRRFSVLWLDRLRERHRNMAERYLTVGTGKSYIEIE